MSYRRAALLFFDVIHEVSRSHRLTNRRFGSNLNKITRPVAAIKSLRFALLKNCWLNSFHTWHLSFWGDSHDPYTFSCSYPLFRPSGGQIFGRKWGFRNFLKKKKNPKKLLVPFITYLAFTLRGWVSWPLFIFVFLASFSAPWWANIWPKKGFWNFLKKLLAQFISYLAYTLMGWVSWPVYIVVFLASFSTLWWPKILWQIGFPDLGYFWMNWIVIRAGVYCPHLWAKLVWNWLNLCTFIHQLYSDLMVSLLLALWNPGKQQEAGEIRRSCDVTARMHILLYSVVVGFTAIVTWRHWSSPAVYIRCTKSLIFRRHLPFVGVSFAFMISDIFIHFRL